MKINPDHHFFTLTKNELDRAAAILVDHTKIQEALDSGDDCLVSFVYDEELRDLLNLWYDNNCDMVATKLAAV